ncbi:hypothetical protein BC332_22761 [Capsicum chinense]|nr:hypothetical protein BC332_22761 [Capsicum chinense]
MLARTLQKCRRMHVGSSKSKGSTQVEWLYFVAFALVFTGLIIYSKTAKDPVIEEANADDQRYQLLNDDEEQADHRHDEKTVS